MLILDLWGIRTHAVVVFALGKNLLFKSVLGHWSVNFEMSFWYLQFSQETNEKIQLYYYGTSSRIVFLRILGELKTPKRHFQIN